MFGFFKGFSFGGWFGGGSRNREAAVAVQQQRAPEVVSETDPEQPGEYAAEVVRSLSGEQARAEEAEAAAIEAERSETERVREEAVEAIDEIFATELPLNEDKSAERIILAKDKLRETLIDILGKVYSVDESSVDGGINRWGRGRYNKDSGTEFLYSASLANGGENLSLIVKLGAKVRYDSAKTRQPLKMLIPEAELAYFERRSSGEIRTAIETVNATDVLSTIAELEESLPLNPFQQRILDQIKMVAANGLNLKKLPSDVEAFRQESTNETEQRVRVLDLALEAREEQINQEGIGALRARECDQQLDLLTKSQ